MSPTAAWTSSPDTDRRRMLFHLPSSAPAGVRWVSDITANLTGVTPAYLALVSARPRPRVTRLVPMSARWPWAYPSR